MGGGANVERRTRLSAHSSPASPACMRAQKRCCRLSLCCCFSNDSSCPPRLSSSPSCHTAFSLTLLHSYSSSVAVVPNEPTNCLLLPRSLFSFLFSLFSSSN